MSNSTNKRFDGSLLPINLLVHFPTNETKIYDHPLFWLLLGIYLGIYGQPFVWLKQAVHSSLGSLNPLDDLLNVNGNLLCEKTKASTPANQQLSPYAQTNDQNAVEAVRPSYETKSLEITSPIGKDIQSKHREPNSSESGLENIFNLSEREGITNAASSCAQGGHGSQILMLSSISSTETPPLLPCADTAQLNDSDQTVATMSKHNVFEMMQEELDSIWTFWGTQPNNKPAEASDFFTSPIAVAMVGLRLAIQHNCVQFAEWYMEKINHWPDKIREEVMMSIYTDVQLPLFKILTWRWCDGSGLKARVMEKCAYNGAFEIVQYMLQQNDEEGTKWWDSSQFRRGKNVALIAASAAGHISIVELLTRYGADIYDRGGAEWFFWRQDNRQVTNFNRPIFVAEENIRPPHGYSDFVRLLQTESADGEEFRLMEKALETGSPELILCLLLNHIEFDPNRKERERALAIAITTEHGILTNMILEADVNINNIPPILAFRTPLHCVAARGNEELVRRFIQLGSNVNNYGSWTDWGGNCALMAASSCGHAQVVRTLLDHGAKIEGARCQFGDVLQTVCFLGYADVLQTLLDMQPAGLDWNVKTPKGADLLSLAAQPLLTQRKWELKRADNARLVKILTSSVPVFRQRYASRIPALSLA